MEIGSIYEINPLLMKNYDCGSGGKMPVPLEEPKKYGKKYCCYTASGREAIALALKSLERDKPNIPKKCLLPAYMCDTVFFPFEHAGWELSFYHIHKNLEADEQDLCALIERVKPGLLFIHPYYGVDTCKNLRPQLADWKKQGICIMEDVTQSYYLEKAGAEADYIIGSLRKWYPVPDGGFVLSDRKLPSGCFSEAEVEAETEVEMETETEIAVETEVETETETKVETEVETETETKTETEVEAETEAGNSVTERLALLMQKWEYLYKEGTPSEKQAIKADFLKKNRLLEKQLDAYKGIRKLSDETAFLLQGVKEEEAKLRRIQNYHFLYENLKGKTSFVPILNPFGSGAQKRDANAKLQNTFAPLYFAVYAKERDDLQQFLGAHDIYAPVLWPIGKENEPFLSKEEQFIFSHMLAIPMDQRYGQKEMQRIVEVMNEYEKPKPSESGGKESVIGIRADANDTVATGHIMRCITIAKQLKQMGSRIVFFTADDYAHALLAQADMEQICLHTKWDDMKAELPLLRKELKRLNCKKLLVDSYQADAAYFDSLKDLCKLIYIDDCFEQVYPVDLLINYNAYHVRFPYEKSYRGKTQLLLGTSYVPLREEFQGKGCFQSRKEISQKGNCLPAEKKLFQAKENFQPKGELPKGKTSKSSKEPPMPHVLLSCGGGDFYNVLTGILTEAVKDSTFDNVVFHTVVGRFNQNKEALTHLSKKYPNIRLHYDVTNMAELMSQCNAAVSAAGTMLFELSAMQVPSIFFVCADNQQYDSEFFAQEERMLFAGDIRADRQTCIMEICQKLAILLKDDALRERMKKALLKVTDGQGTLRIAQAVRAL